MIDRKISALVCHASQITDPDGTEDRIRSWGAMVAADAGLEPGRLAEGFQRVVTSL